MSSTRVSIVIVTHDRRQELLRTLVRLQALPEQPPIYVVDNASSDGTATVIARDFPSIRCIRLHRNMGAAGRNIGVAAASTPYIAFCDDDTWWAPGALTEAADVLDRFPPLAAVTAQVLVGKKARLDPACDRMAGSPLPNELGVPGTAILGFMAGACMMRRSAFLDAGGYQPRFFLGREEALLAMDLMTAGWHMAYVPSVRVYHYPSAARDSEDRRRLLLRNALWCVWLRRPWRSVLRESLYLFAQALPDQAARRGVLEALCGLPWILQNRQVVPPRVEYALRQVQRR